MAEKEPEIIYEDENIVVLDKPSGLLVHPIKGPAENTNTLAGWLFKNRPETKNTGDEPESRPGIFHRLDKETSGVIIAAKNQKTFEFLKKQFQNREIKKTYLVLVKGTPKNKNGIIDFAIARSAKSPLKKSASAHKKGTEREAVTEYKTIKYYEGWTLAEAYPKTGRTHQIRVHFKALGHPVYGDELYSKTGPGEKYGRLFLHAKNIEFTAPNGSRMKIEADIPEDLARILQTLKEYDKN